MPIRQLADAGAQSTVSGAITAVQTSVTLLSASGFPGILSGGQLSVTILDSGNPAFNAAAPLATPFEYQPVNTIAGNVLTFGPGGGAASRAAYAGTTPRAYFAGATVAAGMLAEDIIASAPWKFDDQSPTASSVTIPASGTIPASYLGINWRDLLIVGIARSNAAQQATTMFYTFNGDSGPNYTWQKGIFNNGTVTHVTSGVATTSIDNLRIPAANALANYAGYFRILICDFAQTTFYKHTEAFSQSYETATAAGEFEIVGSGNWQNTAAITSVLLSLTGSLVAGSRIRSYLIP